MRIDWHCVCGDAEASHTSKPDGEYCYGHCQKTERDCDGRGYRPIDHQDRTPAFSFILTEAQKRYLPKYFTCDLSTDYQALQDYDGRFIWVLRVSGTELYRLDDQSALSLGHSKAALDYWTSAKQGHADNLCFYWGGYKDPVLLPVSSGYALERIDEAIERAQLVPA